MSSNHHHHHNHNDNNHHPIQSHVRHLYLNKKMSDFNFIVGQTQTIIPGHKFLFSIISPVFYRMFYQNELPVACVIDNNTNNNNNNNNSNNINNSTSNNNNCNNEVYITNINYFSFIEFLKYIYFSEIFVTQKIIKDILQLSTDFEMDELKEICVEYLVKNLYLQNALYFLHLAIEYKLHVIKEKCLNIIGFNYTKITNDYLFLNLHEDLLMIILKSNYFKCFEYQILSGLLNWLKTYCVTNNIKINSIEYYNLIQKFFYFIRFNNINESCLGLINFRALNTGCPNFIDKNFVIQNYLFKNNKSNRNERKVIKTRYELACELKYYQRFTRVNHIVINNKIKKFTDLYFMVNEQVYCYGFGILGPTENGVKLLPQQVVTVTLQNSEVSVVKIKQEAINYKGTSKTYDIMFEKPLLIKPFDYHYVVIDYDEQSAQLSGENVEHYVGLGCIEEEEIDGILIKYKVNCGKFGSTNAMSRLMSLILSKFEVFSDKRIENIYDYGTDVEIEDNFDFDK